MGITDIFKTKRFKSDAERLADENAYLKSLLTPEMQHAHQIRDEILRLNTEKQHL